jgi:hypothetical protein
MTINLTVAFLVADGAGRLVPNGNDIFGVLKENNIEYSYREHGYLGEFADFEIQVENYFQFQALGDFIFNSK